MLANVHLLLSDKNTSLSRKRALNFVHLKFLNLAGFFIVHMLHIFAPFPLPDMLVKPYKFCTFTLMNFQNTAPTLFL
jgi:hypothetical protein